MTIENVLFDLDGTLTNPICGITESIQYALKELGLPIPAADTLAWCIGPPLIGSLRKILGSDSNLAETALSLYRRHYDAEGKFKNEIYSGIPEMLKSLLRLDINLYVATSKLQSSAYEILDHFDLLNLFKEVYGGQLDNTLVDKEELIAYILEKEGIAKRNVIMVGDRSFDIIGAKKNEILSLGVTYGYGTREELEDSNAQYIVDSPKDIVKIINNL